MSRSWEHAAPWRVAFAERAPREALLQTLETLATGERPDNAEVVKHTAVRLVFRTRLPDGGEIFVKSYRTQGPRETLTRGSRAAAEFTNLERVRERGLPAVEPLCCAERRSHGRLEESILITRALDRAVELSEVLSDLDAASLDALAGRLGRVARTLHDVGLWHRDLHLGNLVAIPGDAPIEPVLIDLQKMLHFRTSLPAAMRVRDLAMLYPALRAAVDGECLSRFVSSYARAGGRALDARRLEKRVRRSAARMARRRLRSRGRRCVIESTRFRVQREPGLRIYRRADVDSASVLGAIEAHRRIVEAGDDARAMNRGPSGLLSRIDDVDGGPPARASARLFRRGPGSAEPGAPVREPAAVREFARLRPGMREWRLAHAALLRELEVPAPLALVEVRRGRERRSYVVSRWHDRALDLGAWLDQHPADTRAVRAVAACLGRMHACGLRYRCLRLGHFLLMDEAEGSTSAPRVLLLHADELELRRRVTLRQRAAELRTLLDAISSRLTDRSPEEIAGLLSDYADGGVAADRALRSISPGHGRRDPLSLRTTPATLGGAASPVRPTEVDPDRDT